MTIVAYILTAFIIYIAVGFVMRKVLQGPDESTYSIIVLWPVLVIFIACFWVYAKVSDIKRRK